MIKGIREFDLSTLSNSKEGATYGFTVIDGVFTPENKGVASSFAYAKVTFTMPFAGTLRVTVSQSSEKNYDYGILSALDSALEQSTSLDSTGIRARCRGLEGTKSFEYSNVPAGEHFITFKYRKDSSVNKGDDAFTVTSMVATTAFFDLATLGLSAGSYNIVVRAKDASNAPSDSEVLNINVPALTTPSTKATEEDGELIVTDSNGTNKEAFNVYKANGTLYSNIQSSADSLSLALENGVSYYVKAVGYYGQESNASNLSTTHECFVAGTPVMMADGSYKMIEEIVAGDRVQSYDIESSKYIEGTVTEVVTGYTDRIAMVLFEDSNYVAMAEGHPLYTADGWHSITNKDDYPTLVVGDRVLGAFGYVAITDIQVVDTEPVMVYSLSVSVDGAGGAPYFAGAGVVLATHGGGSH